MKVLGIETSCDETGIAIYTHDRGLVAHQLHSQIELHTAYGGVIPELASRDHNRMLLPLVQQTLQQANLTLQEITRIAYTAGPGLMGALLVGAAFAKSLGLALNKPTLGIHHMEGHLLAPMLENKDIQFPFLALLVSGGHTLLVSVQALGSYKILGESLDDAVGEAFDKTAKLLGLSYPGGAALAQLAEKGQSDVFSFPRPMKGRPGFDFSFSGLKTAVLHTLNAQEALTDTVKANIAASFEAAVVDTLWARCAKALAHTGFNTLVVGGGVGANQSLRNRLTQEMASRKGQLFFPSPMFCTDNGAMIAYAGFLRFAAGQQDESLAIHVRPRWSLEKI